MGLLKRLLGPPNAIILSVDRPAQALEDQILEAREYYTFVPLGHIVDKLLAGASPAGLAAVTVTNPRKGFFLKTVPFLRGEGVPFTLFLRPDCIGLNRLPPEEELAIFFAAYPDKLAGRSREELLARAWADPEGAERLLLDLRREVGPLPLEGLDPSDFFSTWGKILELPPDSRELGLNVFTGAPEVLAESVAFARRQTGADISLAFSAHAEQLAHVLRPLGIRALLSTETGAVTRDTNPWRLPVWSFEETP